MDVYQVAQGADDRLREVAGPVAALRATFDQADPVLARVATLDATRAGRFVPPAPTVATGTGMPREGARLLGHAEIAGEALPDLALRWTMKRMLRDGSAAGMTPDQAEDAALAMVGTDEGSRLFGAALAESAMGVYASEPDLLGTRYAFEHLPQGDEDDAQALFAISAAEVVMSLEMVPDMHAAHVQGYRLCGMYEAANEAPIGDVFDRQATVPQDDVESFGYDCVRASLGLSHHVKGVTIPKLDLSVEPDASPALGR